jgi:glutaconate CoA-transferase subunit A
MIRPCLSIRFNAAVRDGAIRLKDATCPAIHAGLIAAQKGSLFMPLRGLIGSDSAAPPRRLRVTDNADDGDPIVLIPAIQPDVAIFHAPMADRFGNVWIGRSRELAAMAHASATVLVTVERIEEGLLANEMSAAGVLPAIYVTAVSHAPRGAWPYGLSGEYGTDTAELVRYAKAARTADGFESYMSKAQMEPA